MKWTEDGADICFGSIVACLISSEIL